MGAFERMKNALLPLEIYSPEKGIVFAELLSYAAAIDLIREKAEEIRRNRFALTADDKGLLRMERILQLPAEDMSLEERRKRILSLTSKVPLKKDYPYLTAKIEELLGEKYYLEDDAERKLLFIYPYWGEWAMAELKAAADFMAKYLPADVRPFTEAPMPTWEEIHMRELDFETIRETGIPWAFFDETIA